MDLSNAHAIELLMDNMKKGVIYVDGERRIRICNNIAKEITGIVFDVDASHDAGRIAEGDIVILADNKLGEDDGNLGSEELEMLNIADKNIQEGDTLVAVGVYRNKKIEAEYKYVRGQLMVPLELDVNYFGFHITASIDVEKKENLITVNGKQYKMDFFSSVGNMVIIDGSSGEVKFFQAKGYSIRHEDAGMILRGQEYFAKIPEDINKDVVGMKFLDIFDESRLSERLFAILDGNGKRVANRLYEINKRPIICDIVPWHEEGWSGRGAFLIIRDAVHLDQLLEDRNEIIRQIEGRGYVSAASTLDLPEGILEGFTGQSAKTNEVKYMAYKAANNKFNIIITGESGTGKSRLAREIHNMGNPNAPFVEVNCNAIAPSLFESELFGYVSGAFTGASSGGKVGFFEAANKGTIFLDEIGELPMDIQVKLLHVLQNKVIYRVGSSKPIKVDVRVIAATNRNLEEEVAQGRFRQDLYYRINVFPIEIPPIRERKGDLYLLINQLMKNICDDYGLEPKMFSGEALQKMISYNWPGNVRELENVIERAVTLCDSNIIYGEHLRIGKGNIPRTMKEMLAKEEERILEMTLLKYNGNKQKAMEELDMSRSIFYDKLKKYNIRY
ncbi:MAG: sigma-54-dependent Fis family transcriptional regulator [Firmicutes bacterium]|nr:sigma-54-dependent Fis family transcriptional regulator [Bacillota bacterium]